MKSTARKKIKRGIVSRAGGVERARLSVYLEPSTAMKLRRYAFESGSRISDVVEEAITELVDSLSVTGHSPLSGCVYFIRDTHTGSIKIGHTGGPVQLRIAALQTANPHDLELLGTVSGGPDVESALHQRFEAQRLRGEWFSPSETLLAVARGQRPISQGLAAE